MIQDIHPGLDRRQATQAFDRHIRPANKAFLTGIVKAQGSTEKRSQITVAQQFRWHSAVERAFTFLRKNNIGESAGAKSFGELMPHFILGGDETGLLASNGDVSIIGDKQKKKHEVTTAGSRVSITVYRLGNAAGSDGPTVFMPPGKYRKAGFSDAFLLKHGAAPGSTIVMTDSGYMTEAAWVEMAPVVAAGIRAMPIIRDHPDWWVVKIIDGFGPHTSSLEAMKIYEAHKIMLLKEEGDTSHVCQAYDQEVAKADKRCMRTSLAFLRRAGQVTKGNTPIDGWQLIHVALAIVRELEAGTWVHSFKKVNLHPHHRVSFVEWCERISHFLQGGETFKKEASEVDFYKLLPSFWHGFTPEQKQRAMAIFNKHGNKYSVDCVAELAGVQGFVQMADMQNLRLCLDLAVEHPSHLERGAPEPSAVQEPAEVQQAAASINIKEGLHSLCLHPKQPDGTPVYTGKDLFEHLSKLLRRCTPRGQVLAPSSALNCEITAEQQQLLDPTAQDFAMQTIMSATIGEGAKKNLAKRKLDSLGNLRGACGWANDEVCCPPRLLPASLCVRA